ncbi:MAG: MFS transporter [Peptococcaceae bacterium]|nr:MFS transporter [Peptococcaceae bacterium]
MVIKQTSADKLWTGQYFLFMAVSLLFYLQHYTFFSLLPLYAMKVGGNNTVAGMMTGVFSLVSLLFRPLFGRMLDLKGRKPVVITGLGIIVLVTFSYNFCFNASSLIVIRIIHGAGFSAGTTAISTVVADIVPKKRLAEGIGYFGLSNTLAQALGPLIGLWIIQSSGFNQLFLLTAAISLVSLICALLVKYRKGNLGRENIDQKNKQQKQPLSSGAAVLSRLRNIRIMEPALIAPAAVTLFITTSNGAVQTFVAKYALSRGIEDIGVFFTVFAIFTALSRVLAGKLSNRFGLGGVLVLAIVIMLLSQLTLVFAHQLFMFLIAAMCYGLALGFWQPTLNTIFVLFSSPERKGRAIAVFYSSVDIGIGVSAIILGRLSQAFGFPIIYVCTFCCCLITLAIYFLALRSRLIATEQKLLGRTQ